MCMRVSCKKNNFFRHLKVTEERSRIRRLDRDSKPDPLVKRTDPRIRIRTKMSWIPYTAKKEKEFCTTSLLPSSPSNISLIISKLMTH
jgi:hypothetical protein